MGQHGDDAEHQQHHSGDDARRVGDLTESELRDVVRDHRRQTRLLGGGVEL
jgi:hypothetical protein